MVWDLAAAAETRSVANRPATPPTLLAWAPHPVPPQAHFRPSRGGQHIISPDLARAYYGPCAAPPAACARPRAFNLDLDLFNITPYYRFKANYLYKGGWLLVILLPPSGRGQLLEVALLGSIVGSMLHWLKLMPTASSTPPSLPPAPHPSCRRLASREAATWAGPVGGTGGAHSHPSASGYLLGNILLAYRAELYLLHARREQQLDW